jgi:bifunctional non-homologous end joining protein LigD
MQLFGALTLALHERDSGRYIGHFGGFRHEVLEELHGKLIKLKTAKLPFGRKTKDEAVTTWVKPKFVAETEGQARARCAIPFISAFARTSWLRTSHARVKSTGRTRKRGPRS